MTKEVRPWDLMHPSTPRASGSRAAERLAVCKQCPQFNKALQQCKICKCIMPMKVTLEMATCPENRWDDHSQ